MNLFLEGLDLFLKDQHQRLDVFQVSDPSKEKVMQGVERVNPKNPFLWWSDFLVIEMFIDQLLKSGNVVGISVRV